MLMLMLINSIYPRADLVTKVTTAAHHEVTSLIQRSSIRRSSDTYQRYSINVGPRTAKTTPYMTRGMQGDHQITTVPHCSTLCFKQKA